MAETQMTKRIYGRKTNDRKTYGRLKQNRTEIWPKGRLTEKLYLDEQISERKKFGKQTVSRIATFCLNFKLFYVY